MFYLTEEPCALGPLLGASLANVGWAEWASPKPASESRDSKAKRPRLSMRSGAPKHMPRELLGKVWFGRRLEAVVRGTVGRVSEPHTAYRGAQA